MANHRMNEHWTLVALTTLLVVTSGRLAIADHAPHSVRVELASGRTLEGEVDLRTDDERLWLRFATESTELLRPIRWDRVAAAHRDGAELTHADLKRLAAESSTFASGSATQHEDLATPHPNARTETTDAERAAHALAAVPAVASVALDAFVADWDADVEADGLVVHVYPLSTDGQIIPVDGTLEINLTALRAALTDKDRPQPLIGRWVHRITPDQTATHATGFKLPFQSRHPDFDQRLAPIGIVNVRLSVPGQGTFDASLTDVRLRHYSAVRDHLWHYGGSRFLDSERLGRTN